MTWLVLAENEYDKFHQQRLKLEAEQDNDFEKAIALVEAKKSNKTKA